ncbi:Clavaminate synthase-like protein, partial [Aureobasidium melanogenum]
MDPTTPIAPRSRSTFKSPPRPIDPYARPPSPASPQWEPLSPPHTIEPTLNYSAVTHSAPSTRFPPATASQRSEKPRGHKRSPSTIEALADVASTSPRLPPAAPSVQSSADNFVTPGPVRGTKRARSDAGPGPQPYPYPARPSSSHHFSHPGVPSLAYNTDRQRRQSTNTTTVTSLEDAELLLNFAGRVASQPPPPAPPRRHAPPLVPSANPANFYTNPQALPPHTYPYVPPPPYAAQVFVPEPVAPVAATSVISENASASLPSPQDTNEDEKSTDTDKEIAQGQGNDLLVVADVSEPPRVRAPQQTHTPPEEERRISEQGAAQGVLPTQETTELPAGSVEHHLPTDAPAARPRRGWPKGKPRGPRNKNSTTTKPRSSARRSRASTAKSIADSSDSSAEEKRPRRKSDSDLASPYSEQLQNRSKDTRAATVPPGLRYEILQLPTKPTPVPRKPSKEVQETVCASCALTRESNHGELDQWISCNGCQLWFHFDCAGFKNERDVRDVSKFFCKACEPKHGSTTFVRKSGRAHAAVDYAGLNQGILKTSDDNPEHHYIQPIKDGSFTFDQEMFPRMRPELVTREFFETCSSFSEPVVIPAEYNPKLSEQQPFSACDNEEYDVAFTGMEEEEALLHDFEYETVPDDGQDRLDMVVPRGLTVRHVAELVGPHEPLEVIDVKTQGTEGKWNLAKWADYYEADGEKAVRNVISLEVSSTKLGRLLRRPKVVRDIDLQDSVWPEEETLKGNFPKVQFYCLMSVADSFTDFHIDFGGSSVYYHILRGKKTFFFIPPKPGHLKKYEDWNNSHEQNFTWLPDATKECYRVDLSAGDTMLIPSGWIHAVWTPENSLVIGGNFLTRMHYSTQFRIVDIEKAIKTPQKFRYPHFQKVMWYTVIKYLETDPLPAEVAQVFYSGARFVRERPVWEQFNQHGKLSSCAPGSAHYNCRYYSQAELDGLPDLINFIFRTVMIALGRIEGVTEDTRKKVMRSIPKSHGEPLELARTFALWVAWKRGNEDPPAWAHPDADLPDKESAAPKKLSARALKAMQRQEAFEAYRVAPERQSARQNASREPELTTATAPMLSMPSASVSQIQTTPGPSGQHTSTPKTSVLGPKRVACDACRKRRIKCKHKDVVTTSTPFGQPTVMFQSTPSAAEQATPITPFSQPLPNSEQHMQNMPSIQSLQSLQGSQGLQNGHTNQMVGIAPMAQMTSTDGVGPAIIPGNALLADPNSKRGRSKACLDCRKSKRRCIHDENGKIDPVKAEQTPVPRGSVVSKKRRTSGDMESPIKKSKQARASQAAPVMPFTMESSYQTNMVSPQQYKQYPYAPEANIPHWQHASYMYPDPTSTGGGVILHGGPYHQQSDLNGPYNAQSLEQLANEVLDSRYVNDGDYTVPQANGDSLLHPALQQQGSVSSQTSGTRENTSPLLAKAYSSSHIPADHDHAGRRVDANETEYRPSSSGGPVQLHTTDSSGLHFQSRPDVTKAPREVTMHSAPLDNGLSAAAPVQPDQEAAAPPVDAPLPPSKGADTLPEKSTASLAVAPPTGLASIPLYQPPAPPLTKSQTPRTERHSFSASTEKPNIRMQRSLSKTPVPTQATPSTELKTPRSAKHKRDSLSVTPENIPESIPVHRDPRSGQATKKRALSPRSKQSAHLEALFANPDKPINLPSSSTNKPSTLPPEIVANVQGSSAGAGSGEFHVYKASRRREYERLRAMDEEKEAEEKDAEFEAKRKEQEKKDADKTEKNRLKREKARQRKEKSKLGPQQKGGNAEDGKKEEKKFKPNVAVKTDGKEEGDTGPVVEEQGIVFLDED